MLHKLGLSLVLTALIGLGIWALLAQPADARMPPVLNVGPCSSLPACPPGPTLMFADRVCSDGAGGTCPVGFNIETEEMCAPAMGGGD